MALFVKEVLLMGHMTPVELKKCVHETQSREDTPIRCTPYLTPIICSATLHMIKCMAHTLLPVLMELEGEGCLNVCLFNMSRVILNAHLDRKKTRQVVKGDLILETEYKGEIELRVGRDRGG